MSDESSSALSHSWRRDKDGHLIHDGDCHFWSFRLCTCGLLHFLNPREDKEELYPDFWPEYMAMRTQVDAVCDTDHIERAEEAMVIARQPMTSAEREEMDRLLGTLGFTPCE